MAEVLKPVGELVPISKSSQVNKRYLAVLLQQQRKASLPLEVELNIGMQRYVLLITCSKDPWPVFQPKLQSFMVESQHLGIGTAEMSISRDVKKNFTQG